LGFGSKSRGRCDFAANGAVGLGPLHEKG